jgi:hypothetical protein
MTFVSILLGSVSSGYFVNSALRFRSSASAYLNRTPASAGNRTTWTFSTWAKRGQLSSYMWLLSGFVSVGTVDGLRFQSDNTVDWIYNGSRILATSQLFRDPSAWYHLIFVWDTTQSTSSNRAKIYVNGVQVTAFSTSSYPVQNSTSAINNNTVQRIGVTSDTVNSELFDGYLAEVNFIDGQALTPSSFGAYDTNGIWQPAKYSGSYGTNGFYLPFSNTTSTTTLVQDSSGNGNNWTPNNISLTAGSTYDSMLDSPTVGATASNYAVLNPVDKDTNCSITGGNLDWSSNAAGVGQTRGTIGVSSGKWYWEVTDTSANSISIGISTAQSPLGNFPGNDANSWGYISGNGNKYNNGSGAAYGATYTTNDVIGVALDVGAGTLTYYKNNVSQGTAFTGLTSGPYFPSLGDGSGSTAPSASINFGQRPFTYTPPTGFVALNTFNLPAPTIANGALYNAATLSTGNGTSQSPSNSQSNGGNNALGKTFYPDFVWVKDRTAANNHILANTVAGITNFLNSNTTNAESNTAGLITAVSSGGFSVGSVANVNANADTYVGWQWNAGSGSSASNTNGSITSTVSANPTAGFSVVTYTGTGVAGTIGHGLGAPVAFRIVKARSAVGAWTAYHQALGTGKVMILNGTNAVQTLANYWDTTPTSTVMQTGNSSDVNANGTTFINYCFAAVAGYSAFGSYTGNGSADGPFIYTGFRPRLILTKRSDSTSNWAIVDLPRDPYNLAGQSINPNTANAESTPRLVATPLIFFPMVSR